MTLMPTFRYSALDGQGRSIDGELTAPGAEEALDRLRSYGLSGSMVSECDRPPTAALSAADAAELADQVADLAEAGLPLAGGLRAMAEEMPNSRLGRVLRGMAQRVEAGQSLEDAARAYSDLLPVHVRRMLVAGHRSGRLAVVLEQFVESEYARRDLRHRLWRNLAYPTLLLLMLVGVFLLFGTLVMPACKKMYDDFGTKLPPITEMTLSLFAPGMNGQIAAAGVLIVLLFLLCTTGRPSWAQSVLYAVPLVGPVWRWTRAAQFARLMELMLDQQVPLPEALRLTAEGLDDLQLAAACRKAAGEVEAGRSLAEALGGLRAFPAALAPLVRWGESSPRPADALRAAAEMFERRAAILTDLLDTFAPPILFLMIVGPAGVIVVGLFIPLLPFVCGLRGW